MGPTVLTSKLAMARVEGDIVGRDDSGYDKLRRVWNAMADRRPAAIVLARNSGDVERVVTVASENACPLAIRGGGHSLPGLSTCDDGILLDLSLLKAVTVNKSAGQAEVLGGALLGDLDRAAVPNGLVVPAGVVSHTGAGGLTLGGGMGWLSRRFGLTIDSLLAADIVTADGRLRRISADHEPDLFWAIRGGGGNFGVVTRFVFQMHPLGHVLVGNWAYPVAESGAILRRFRDLAAQAPRQLTASFVLLSGDLLVTAFWSGSPQQSEEAVAQFGKLGRPKSGSVGTMTFLELQSRSDGRLAWNRRYYAKGAYFEDVQDRAIDQMAESIAGAPTGESEVYVLQLGGAVSDIADDATAYTGRAAGYYWIVQSAWDQKSDDDLHLNWCRQAAGQQSKFSMRGNYVNEQADFGKEVAMSAYGRDKYIRLAELKALYDPSNLFRFNQNIEPKR